MKIIYHDKDRSAPRVKWGGVEFLDGVPREVPADFPVLGKIATNPFFEIVREAPVQAQAPAQSQATTKPKA